MAAMRRRDFIGQLGATLAVWPFARAQAEPAALTTSQSDALNAYAARVNEFKSILQQRRAQINAKRPLPNLPGQALYLARNNTISAYKDLTDVLPSKIGRRNKFAIPPAYFDAEMEPLWDEYAGLFDIMQAPPANAQGSNTRFMTLLPWGPLLHESRGSMRQMRRWRVLSASGSFLPRRTATRTLGMRARIRTKEACRQAYPRIKTVRGNGRPSKARLRPSTRP